jgi:hypothetical protein
MYKCTFDDNSNLELLLENGLTQISYKKLDENNNYMDYTLSIADDFIFNACSDDYEQDELAFTINEDNPLYLPFYNLIEDNNNFKLTSDYKREEFDSLCYIEILKENNSIVLKFVNNIKEEHNSIDKFNFVIINIMYDLRSKLDQKETDYKKRLMIFFEEAINSIKEKTGGVKKLKKI